MGPGDIEDSFLTVAEVAATLKLNQQTVRNWIDQGSLPALRVGRRVRIRRSDFQRLLDQGYMTAAAPATNDPRPTAEDFWSGETVGLAEPPHAAPDRGEPLTAGLDEPLTAGRDEPRRSPGGVDAGGQ